MPAAPRPGLVHRPDWTGAARLLAAACAGALAAALWLPASRTSAPARAAAALPAPDAPALVELRAEASLGRPYAALDLITALLKRYEASADEAALVEAMLVLDSAWDQPEVLRSGVIQRVLRTYCPTERLLTHFWLCESGE